MNANTTPARVLRSVLLAATLCVPLGPAWAAPWVTAPTSDAQGGVVEVNGGGLPPNGQVLLSVVDASGAVVGTYVTDVDGEGRFSYDVPVEPSPDSYLLEVWDVAGTGTLPLTQMQLNAGSGQ